MILYFCSLVLDSKAAVVQYITVNTGLSGTEIREVRNGQLGGFRYENSFLGTRNYEQGVIFNISSGVSTTYMYSGASSTQIYAISATDNARIGGMAYFGEFLPVRVYGFIKEVNGSAAIVEPPAVSNSSVEGINGNVSVGWAVQGGKRSGFFKFESSTNSTYYKLDYSKTGFNPSSSTEATGIFGSTIVGTTTINGVNYGYAWNSSNGTFSDPFLAVGSSATFFNDFNDGLIAGTATLNGVNTPFLLDPFSSQIEYFANSQGYSSFGSSYDNGVLAGTYTTSSGQTLGYYAYVPEPNTSTLIALSLCLQVLLNRSRRLRTK
jgi:hypothetical protein